jgi:3-methyladenine DNA glycosylase/8-oxoguanine DNA glycosylase
MMCRVESRSIDIEGPLDLRRTLWPLHGRFGDDGWWTTARTPQGPGTLRVSRTRTALVGDAWGPGGDWLLGRLGAIGGLEDDPKQFVTSHPVVAELHRRNPGLRFGGTALVFDALVAAICAQKVTGTEARRAVRGLRRRFSGRAPGPDQSLMLPPDPVAMATAAYHEYHELHLEKRRADLLRRVAARAAELDALAAVEAKDAAAALQAIPGIAVWSAAKTVEVSHGDPDRVAVGDYHFKHIVVHHLTGRDRGTDEEMLDLLEPFRPHRGRVIRLLHTLGHEPKFGPRTSPRDFTRT